MTNANGRIVIEALEGRSQHDVAEEDDTDNFPAPGSRADDSGAGSGFLDMVFESPLPPAAERVELADNWLWSLARAAQVTPPWSAIRDARVESRAK